MSCIRVDHIALTVESIRQAENFYTQLFGLDVIYREGTSEEGWQRWSAENCGETHTSDGRSYERCCLGQDGFRLFLIKKPAEYTAQSRIDHVCLRATLPTIHHLRKQAERLDCRMEPADSSSWIMEDPYGVRWWVMSSDGA